MLFSTLTGSEFAISLMRNWLKDTESIESTSFLLGLVLHVGSALEFDIVRIMGKDEILSQAYAARVNGSNAIWQMGVTTNLRWVV